MRIYWTGEHRNRDMGTYGTYEKWGHMGQGNMGTGTSGHIGNEDIWDILDMGT